MTKHALLAALLFTTVQFPAMAEPTERISDNISYAQGADRPFTPPEGSQNPGYAPQYRDAAPDAMNSNAQQAREDYNADDVQYTDNGQVKYVTGGVSDGGMEAITSLQRDYNLKLLFVGNNGMYLADVATQVADGKGNVLLETTTTGPVLLAQLPPGNYKITATVEGVTKTQRINVGKRKLASVNMRFPVKES